MKLVLAASHTDIKAALRLMGWLGWLSEKNDRSMLNESVLLVVSRRASRYPKFKELCWLAARIFGEARCYVPETEYEHGWPGAANWMFQKALEHVERHFPDDIFFLEPDGMPITPDWYDRIQGEWLDAQAKGKTFMGAYVPHDVNHMTGIAVYGKNWRKVAPSLINVPDNDAWDTHAGKETVPNAHLTKLIQHVFRRHDPGWGVPSLGILDRNAVLFHQDKMGRLPALLDQAYYSGQCRVHPLFSYELLGREDAVMRKFYYAANVTKAIVAHGKRFPFEACRIHGGAIPGSYSTEVETDQAALAELTGNPATGVTELPKEEWESVTKKKAPMPQHLNTSSPLKDSLQKVALLPTPSQSPAVPVAEPGSQASKSAPGITGPIKDIADVIKTDTVQPAQLSNIGTKLPRPEKRSHFNINRQEGRP